VLVPDIRSSRSGKISTLAHPAIGFFYPRRLDIPQFNNVPIGRELGYDVELPQFRSIVVKAGTDPALVKKLSDELGKVAQTGEFKVYLRPLRGSKQLRADRQGARVHGRVA
jgi:tripartite-type tricarboxylate transporter receptor subunit TctC